MAEQNMYAIMEWPTDHGKLSIHHLNMIMEPIKPWNDYSVGDEGKAKYPGSKELWQFKILAVGGSRKSLATEFYRLLKEKNDKCLENPSSEEMNVTVSNVSIVKENSNAAASKKVKKAPTKVKTTAKKNQGKNQEISAHTGSDSDNELEPAIKRQALQSAVQTLLLPRNDNTPKDDIPRTVIQPTTTFQSVRTSLGTYQSGTRFHLPHTPRHHYQLPGTSTSMSQSPHVQGTNQYPSNVYSDNLYTCSNSSFSGFTNFNSFDDSEPLDSSESIEPSTANYMHDAYNTLYGDSSVHAQTSERIQEKAPSNHYGCHKCCDLVQTLLKDVADLKTSHEKLKKKLKKGQLLNKEQDGSAIGMEHQESESELINGQAKEEFEKAALGSANITEAVKNILKMAFSMQELVSCSIKGQRKNKSFGDPRPGLDEFRRNYVEGLLARCFKMTVVEVRGKMRDRLKLYRRSHGGVEANK